MGGSREEEEKEGWLGIRVTRGVTGVADGISGEIFEYLMARDDKDGIKRGGNSRTFRRLSKVGKGCLSHQPRREIASSDVGEGGGGYSLSCTLRIVLFKDLRMSLFEQVLFFPNESLCS